MINLFTGEFLQHPIPFEMSMDLCSHSCVYCFASVREKKNKFNLKGFIAQMKRYGDGADSFLFRKLREGYPVCLSNNTDPFSANNEAFTESILEYFKIRNIRVFFQTKGGRRATELIKAYGLKSVVYVTITTDSDEISKRIEHNAPVTSERIQLIKDLIDMGNEVIVGINPFNCNWIADERLDELMKSLSQIGVYSFVLSPLVIRRKRVPLYENRDFAGVDVKDVKQGQFRNLNEALTKIIQIQEQGQYKIITHAHPWETQAFNIVKEVYHNKVLPTNNDFFIYNGGIDAGIEVTRENYTKWVTYNFSNFFNEDKSVNLLQYLFVQHKTEYTKHCKENSNLIRMASWYFDILPKEFGFLEKVDKDRYIIKGRLTLRK